MMKLRHDVDMVGFLQMADKCSGEVFYLSPEGDRLNLKSQLSKMLFLAICTSRQREALQQGDISCEAEEDHWLLMPYLAETE